MLSKANSLVFANFNGVAAEDLRALRRDANKIDGEMLVIKKRLLGVLFKNKGVDVDMNQFDSAVGTVFSPKTLDESVSPIYKFLTTMGKDKEEKAASMKKLLGGYDLGKKEFADAARAAFYGQLPTRDVALSGVLGMFIAPLKSFMYLVDQKSKQT